MTEEQKALAGYLLRILSGANSPPIAAKEAEIMSQAKLWLEQCSTAKVKKTRKRKPKVALVKGATG